MVSREPARETPREASRPSRPQPEAAARTPDLPAAPPVAVVPSADEVVMIRGSQKTVETPQRGKAN